MGLGKIDSQRFHYVSFDNENGKFEYQNEFFDYIEGEFLGVGSHEFTFKNRSQKKFDIFLFDEGKIFQVQFGFYTWLTYRLMNQLLNVSKKNTRIRIILQKDPDGNQKVFVKENGTFLKWKHKELNKKLKDLPPAKKEENRNKIIETWFETMLLNFPFDPETISAPEIEEDMPF
jgi:hypothetical protein